MIPNDKRDRINRILQKENDEWEQDLLLGFSIKFNKDTLRTRKVLHRNFALEWASSLAVKHYFLDNSRIVIADKLELAQVSAKYSEWCQRGATIRWKINHCHGISVLMAMLLTIVSVIAFPFLFWDTGNIGRVVMVGEPVALLIFSLLATWRFARRRDQGDNIFLTTFFTLLVFLLWLAAVAFIAGDYTVTIGELSTTWHSPLGITMLLAVSVALWLWFRLLVNGVSLLSRPFTRNYCRGFREELAFYHAALTLSELIDWHPGQRRLPYASTLLSLSEHLENLRHRLQVGDAGQRAAILHRVHQAAHAVHEKIIWTALPKLDTQQHLREFIVNLMTTLIEEAYDELPAPSSSRL